MRSIAKRFAAIGAAVVAAAVTAGAASAADVLRPTTPGSEFAYPAQELTFPGHRAVVHYLTTGPDAPALDDPNGNGVPEYVEYVAAAADAAFGYYATQGFLAPTPDTAGPDDRPDVYIKRLDDSVAGIAIATFAAEGGSFFIVQPNLQHGTAGTVQGSLEATVAHELFHVVQYAYLPNGNLPRWFAEGTASAMELLVYPDVFDSSTSGFVDKWLAETFRPIYDEEFGCERCYGGAFFWWLIARDDPGFLVDYLGRLYGYDQQGVDVGFGLQPLEEVFKKRGYGGLYDAFTKLARNLYRNGLIPVPTYKLKARIGEADYRQTRVQVVDGLSMHYIPVTVPANAKELIIGSLTGGGPKPDITVITGGPDGRAIKPDVVLKGRGMVFDVKFRNAQERKNVVIIVTSGRKVGVGYRLFYKAFR